MCLVAIVVWARRLVTRLALSVITVILILLSVGAGINAHFDYFPTLADALGRNGAEGSLHTLRTAGPRSTSLVVTVTIPGRRSHFSARQALVYAPPAYFNRPRPQLPVIIMLHGTPGTPDNWVVAGDAQSTADAFARANGGVAPVLVMPDVNGSYTADTECVNSQAGNAESYLTRDVPAFIDAQLYVAPAGKKWAIAGFSEGGMCSVLLALRHDKLFTTFGDYGGLEGPRATENNNLGDTVRHFFGGSQSDFDAHRPRVLLGRHRYPDMGGWFEVGTADAGPYQAAQLLVPLAQRAGIETCVTYVPGGEHTFQVWSAAFRDSLPWIAGRLGLTPRVGCSGP